jgi:hypothetical protein
MVKLIHNQLMSKLQHLHSQPGATRLFNQSTIQPINLTGAPPEGRLLKGIPKLTPARKFLTPFAAPFPILQLAQCLNFT